jgi:hypothetical protein
VPHISECRTCGDCIVDTPSEPNRRYLLLKEEGGDHELGVRDQVVGGVKTPGPYVNFADQHVPVPPQCLWDPASIRLGPNSYKDAPVAPQQLHCARCRGCTATLTNISTNPKVVAGIAFKSGIGGTDNWLFYGQKPGAEQQ